MSRMYFTARYWTYYLPDDLRRRTEKNIHDFAVAHQTEPFFQVTPSIDGFKRKQVRSMWFNSQPEPFQQELVDCGEQKVKELQAERDYVSKQGIEDHYISIEDLAKIVADLPDVTIHDLCNSFWKQHLTGTAYINFISKVDVDYSRVWVALKAGSGAYPELERDTA